MRVQVWMVVGALALACQGINPDYAPPDALPTSVAPDPDRADEDGGSDPSDEEPEEPDPAQDSEVALKVWLSKGGGVQVQPSGLECDATCETQFATGTTITLIPIPQPGYDFVGWDSPCVGSNGCTMRATETCSGPGNCIYTLSETTSVAGRFERRHFIRVALEGMGTVRSEEAWTKEQGLTCPGTCAEEFPEEQPVRLVATPAEGWRFVEWRGACSGPECRLMLFEDVETTAVFEPLEGGVPGACSALLPAPLEEGVTVTLPQGPCRSGTSDKEGAFALGYFSGPGPVFPMLQFFELHAGEASRIGESVLGGDEGPFDVLAQADGFSLYRGGGLGGRQLSRYSTGGVLLRTEVVTPNNPDAGWTDTIVAPDPRGGLVVARTYDRTHPTGAPLVATVQRYGASSAPASEEIEIGRDVWPVAVGVSIQGNMLVMAWTDAPSRYQAQWLSPAGAPLTGWFTVEPDEALLLERPWGMELEPLLDGGFVLRLRSRFHSVNVLLFEETTQGTRTLPAWLSARPVGRLFPIRAGGGYAVTHSSPCGDLLEVLTPDGGSCGCVDTEKLGPDLTVGLDGSLIAPDSGDGKQCAYRLFPGVLR